MIARRSLAFVVVAVLAGCQDDISTPFPAGLEPFDDDAKTLDLADTRDEMLHARTTDSDMIRVYGRGFVLAAPAVVYGVAHDPAVMIATCSTTSQTVTPDNDPAYELSFVVHYFVDNIVNVEWDDQWRGAVVDGTLDAPALAMIKHQKIQGSDFITTSEGTIEVLATDDPAITELRFVEHLDAVGGTPDDVVGGMQHNFDALVAVSHGGAIPACP
ncbi:MAG TPA: hypothetical protein VFQ53_10915 [Kofleriaceae bacterium]|nr:hypothetical protein [Kofleriaceae bacterium]